MQDNSYAIYQVKDGQDYHLLRFACMDELKRDGQRLRRDAHKVLDAAESTVFPDKAAAEQFLRDEGFHVIHNDDPQMITVRNMTKQEAILYLSLGDGCCWLEGCDTRNVDQTVKPETMSWFIQPLFLQWMCVIRLRFLKAFTPGSIWIVPKISMGTA